MAIEPTIGMLLDALRSKGVTLVLKGEHIHYRGPPSCADLSEMRAIKARRAEAIDYLRHMECVPLSTSQRWWLDLEARTGPLPQPMFYVRWASPVDSHALRRALREIVNRHDALRTRFSADHEPARAVIDAPGDVSLEQVDFTALEAAQVETVAGAYVHEFRLRSFDLQGGPLFRAAQVDLPGGQSYVLMSAHHIIIDGWSVGIIKTELETLYAAYVGGRQPTLPKPAMQMSDFAAWEHEWLRASGSIDPAAYWDERLKHISSIELPADMPRSARAYGFPEGRCALDLTQFGSDHVRDLGRRCRVTTQAILLAVYGLQLARRSRCREILFGNYTLFRWPRGAADVIGCLGGNRPIHLTIEPRASFEEYLRHVWDAYVSSTDFQKVVSTPLAWNHRLNRVVASFSKAGEDMPATPMAQAAVPPPPGWRALPVNHELKLVVNEGTARLNGFISYAANLFLPETIRSFCEDFVSLASAVLAESSAPLSDMLPELAPSGAALQA